MDVMQAHKTFVCLYSMDCSSTLMLTCCGLLGRGCSKLVFAQWRYGCCCAPAHGLLRNCVTAMAMVVAVLPGMVAGLVVSA